MALISNQNQDKRWKLYAFLIIFLFLFILLFRWPLLPNFMDSYYHLMIADGMNRSGGYVTSDFLQYAPVGRPHLYPPLFHFIILAFIKAGLRPLFIARLLDVLIFPLLLAVIWYFMRALFYDRVAYFAVLLASSVYSFYLAASNFMPVTVAVIFGLFSILAEEKNKIVSSSILLSLAFYTHAQIPWVFVAVFLIYGLLNRDRLRKCLITLVSGIVLALPVILYILQNRSYYVKQQVFENFVIEINILAVLFLSALPTVIKEKKRYLILLALAISVIPFIPTYPYRYISGQGLIGFILLAAVGLDNIYQVLQDSFLVRPYYRTGSLLFIAFIVALMLFSPAFCFRQGKNTRFILLDSTYLNLISSPRDEFRTNNYSIASSKFISELVKDIQENTDSGDIIFANIDFMDTMLASLSNRACSRGMLSEVGPYNKIDPLRSSQLVVWFKYYRSDLDKQLLELISQNKLLKIKETEIATLFKNNYTKTKVEIKKPAVPNKVILIIASVILVVLAWDLLFKR